MLDLGQPNPLSNFPCLTLAYSTFQQPHRTWPQSRLTVSTPFTHPTQRDLCMGLCSVMSDSLWPHGLQPTKLLWSWNFPGKNTGVGCHFLFQGIFPTQGLNMLSLCLLIDRLFTTTPPGKTPKELYWPFSFFSLWSGLYSRLVVQNKNYSLEHLSGNPQLFVHLPLLVYVSP